MCDYYLPEELINECDANEIQPVIFRSIAVVSEFSNQFNRPSLDLPYEPRGASNLRSSSKTIHHGDHKFSPKPLILGKYHFKLHQSTVQLKATASAEEKFRAVTAAVDGLLDLCHTVNFSFSSIFEEQNHLVRVDFF